MGSTRICSMAEGRGRRSRALQTCGVSPLLSDLPSTPGSRRRPPPRDRPGVTRSIRRMGPRPVTRWVRHPSPEFVHGITWRSLRSPTDCPDQGAGRFAELGQFPARTGRYSVHARRGGSVEMVHREPGRRFRTTDAVEELFASIEGVPERVQRKPLANVRGWPSEGGQ
jgi:hypothetical protein